MNDGANWTLLVQLLVNGVIVGHRRLAVIVHLSDGRAVGLAF